jgi:hypothetical protein
MSNWNLTNDCQYALGEVLGVIGQFDSALYCQLRPGS